MKKILIITFFVLTIGGVLIMDDSIKAESGNSMNIIRDWTLFKKQKEYIKPPSEICKYEDISAVCGQLIINFRGPLPTEYTLLVIDILKEFGATIVGQLPPLNVIQIETHTTKIVPLKKST